MKISIFQAIFLGVVQGLTEFLPVSSSGHLVFFQSVFGLAEPQLAFDVMLHLGTLLAVVVYFRTDIAQILLGTWAWLKERRKGEGEARLLLWIVVASVPTGLMGVLFKDWFESFFSMPKTVGLMLLVTGMLLWLTRIVKRNEKTTGEMGVLDALIIGIAQGVAIIPGISRSGSTISTGLFRGLHRELAGKFSFLLSIPAILGATLLEFREIDTASGFGVTFIGMAVSFFVGLLSLKLLMNIVKKGRLSYFSYYCWAIGILMILLTK
jgi:undecaprenyl-diphosphatase